jgi:beta-glucosidase-like glycosyl hydrolase
MTTGLENKPLEYWTVLIGMVLYVASRNAEQEALIRRVAKVSASGLLAYGLSPSLAPYLDKSELLAVILVMAFGQILLDVGTALLRDREFIKELIRNKLGKP